MIMYDKCPIFGARPGSLHNTSSPLGAAILYMHKANRSLTNPEGLYQIANFRYYPSATSSQREPFGAFRPICIWHIDQTHFFS